MHRRISCFCILLIVFLESDEQRRNWYPFSVPSGILPLRAISLKMQNKKNRQKLSKMKFLYFWPFWNMSIFQFQREHSFL